MSKKSELTYSWMADSEVPSEVVESLEAVFDKLDQELDMANLDHCCHLAEESSCMCLLSAFIWTPKIRDSSMH